MMVTGIFNRVRLAVLVAWSALPCSPSAAAPDPGPGEPVCTRASFEGARYVLCRADPALLDVRLVMGNGAGGASTIAAAARRNGGERVAFAMNAGMWEDEPRFGPVGLFVSDGVELRPATTRDGDGNFFLKPNGVFFIDAGGPAVEDTDDYLAESRFPAIATQSGPMLVDDGVVHPQIVLPDGASRKIRNAVGVGPDGVALFVITLEPVSFGWLARLYRDELGCPDALYLDGSVSRVHAPDLALTDPVMPLGPILVAVPR